jgi:hypothetical protein
MAKKKSLLDELIETGGASIEAKSMDSDDVTLTSVGCVTTETACR